MSPQKLRQLMTRYCSTEVMEIEHGMYVTDAYRKWRDTPRKWISITTCSGQNFVVEDK